MEECLITVELALGEKVRLYADAFRLAEPDAAEVAALRKTMLPTATRS
jgi:hypothetical protein